MKTVFINGRFLTQPLTGVQRYCHELLRAWDELNPPIELVCLAPPEEFPSPTWKNTSLMKIGRNRGNLWEQVDLPLWLDGRFLFSPANIGPAFYGNQVVTMHDASVFAVPEAYSSLFKAKYRFIFHKLAGRARGILTDSIFSQHELAKHLNRSPARFSVILLGGDHLTRIEPDESLLETYALRGRPFILMVANQSPHKNLARLLEAIQIIKSDMVFVLAGGKNRMVFQDTGAEKTSTQVIPLGYVNDAPLKALYQHATGFVFPSLYEGFGLPILEAMTCGCPVLCSKVASLPEVGGDAVLYFDPLSTEDMALKISQFIDNSSLRESLRNRGRAHARNFTWENTAAQTLELLLNSV